MKKILLGILVLGFMPVVLAGCWNYREVTQLTIIAGVAVDKTEEGEYLLTIEAVDLHKAGRESNLKSVLLETRGKSILDAARNSININYPKLYWGHATTVIISQEVAQDGLAEILDFLCRDAEPRLSMDLLISHGKTAKEILDANVLTAEIKSLEIKDILDEEKSLSKVVPIQVYQFINALGGDGISAIAACIDVTEQKGEKIIQLWGTALFSEDKLIGFIGQEETQSLCFVLNEVRGGVLVVELGPKEEDGKMTFEILKSKTEVKPSYTDGKLSLQVNIETSVALDEVGGQKSFDQERAVEELTKKCEEYLKNQTEGLIKKIQTQYGSDVFGFGRCVFRSLPDVWRKMGKQWGTHFKELEVTVTPIIKFEHSGLLRKPVTVGD